MVAAVMPVGVDRMAGVGATSAAAAISLLDEPEVDIQVHGVRSLDAMADGYWPEISPVISRIQTLAEDPAFPAAKHASLLAAKVLFHLGELEEALEYALAADSLFDVTATTEFAHTLRARCIDEYILRRTAPENGVDSDNLRPVVERILDDCVARGEVKEALGVALEAHRLDRVENAIANGCKDRAERQAALNYCFQCAQTLVTARAYRREILCLIAELHLREDQPDRAATALCFAFVQDAEKTVEILRTLVESPKEDDELLALQIAFDLCDNDTPVFSNKVSGLLQQATNGSAELVEKVDKVRDVLSGKAARTTVLLFLSSKSRTDVYILKKLQSALDQRSSVGHNGLIFANAVMYGGTAIDSFLRENLEWLQRATCWAMFSATACLGLIHARNNSGALNLLSPYLSEGSGSSTPYSDGGALYALGLISAAGGNSEGFQKGAEVVSPSEYILKRLRSANANEIVQHGACLGLGLSAMAAWDGAGEEHEVYEELKNVLFSESAVAGEAAGLAIGLLCVGNGSERVLDEMLAYARDTQHEKIVRGLAMGMALILYGREDDAQGYIEKLAAEKSPILRHGAMFGVALAYCGTADNKAVRMLLHAAVSDVSDDVRRAAVMALGFVMCRHPKQVPKLVALLAESCHDHVRYGAAMAVGIACSGTGLASAVETLKQLATDSSDFVRQGALVSLALVLCQHNEVSTPGVTEARKLFEKSVSDKHEEVLTKFGAVIATGIIDSGGRNASVSLTSGSGHLRMSAVVGLAVFTEFWYWFPLVHFLGLALRPTAFLGLNRSLKMPIFDIKSNAKESMFAYPKNGPPEKARDEKVSAVSLSTTTKIKARARKKRADKEEGKDGGKEAGKDGAEAGEGGASGAAMEVEDGESGKAEVEAEPAFTMMTNPCPVLAAQEEYIEMGERSRYTPIDASKKAGFVMLRDSAPGEPEEVVASSFVGIGPVGSGAAQGSAAAEEEEPGPPEPFEYTEPSGEDAASNPPTGEPAG